MTKTRVRERDGRLEVEYLQVICVRCILPESFPGIEFDAAGVCSYCTSDSERVITDRGFLQAAVADATAGGVSRSYDALALFSGGKDSSLALKVAVRDLGLRVLAFTLDNGFLSAGVTANMRCVLDRLAVDHLMFRPPAGTMHPLYRVSMGLDFGPDTVKYSTAGCGSCISMVLASGLRLAAGHDIPLLVGGWTPGQFGLTPLAPLSFLTDVIGRHFAPLSAASASLADVLAQWNRPAREREPIGLINPLYTRRYSEAETVSELAELGWKAPEDTDSCSTNCRLNAYLIVEHIEKHHYHPYVYELAHHVRIGSMSRAEALEKITKVRIRSASLGAIATELGMPAMPRSRDGGHGAW
jgi:hypothetical protein